MGTVIESPSGRYHGLDLGGYLSFRGISYALPPVQDLRFAAPVRAPRAPDVVDATRWGPTPHRVPLFPGPTGDVVMRGDDILNLNVFAPADSGPGDRLPVLVWIHGGGFRAGTAANADVARFASSGIVTVTVAYRLGFDGFGHLPGAPENRGLLDVICALDWVGENIGAFGGDAERVTVGGQSAGAGLVLALLASPAANGRFARAWASSGVLWADAPEVAALVTDSFAQRLHLEPTVESFSGVSNDVLLRTGLELDPVGEEGLLEAAVDRRTRIGPVLDGEVLPTAPAVALRARSRTVPLMAGVNADEFGRPGDPTGGLVESSVRGHLLRWGATEDQVGDYFRAGDPVTVGGAAGDLLFRSALAAVRTARENAEAPTYLYDYRYRPPASNLALHSMELPAFFGISEGHAGGLPSELIETAHGELTSFIRHGDPGWTCDVRRDIRVYDAVCSYAPPDNLAAELAGIWLQEASA